jgi:hypothetical protein
MTDKTDSTTNNTNEGTNKFVEKYLKEFDDDDEDSGMYKIFHFASPKKKKTCF